MTQENDQAAKQKYGGFPWKDVIGYVLSIVLTLLALWVALSSGFPTQLILAIIFAFALLQAAVQLLMFMHLTETADGKTQTTMMLHALFAFIIIIAGSVWVMWFGLSY